jgi:hypothetical protein
VNRRLAAFFMISGLGTFGVTAWIVVAGVRHPTVGSTIAITLLCAIGVQLAFLAVQSGYELWKGPEARAMRVEAQARSRAAAALEDAETAEKIKLELDAYITVRARRLEIERRRQELSSTVEVVKKLRDELNEAEELLDLESTQLDPHTVEILDSLTEPSRPQIPDFHLYGIPFGQILQYAYSTLMHYMEKKALRRLSHLAPEALDNSTGADGNN